MMNGKQLRETVERVKCPLFPSWTLKLTTSLPVGSAPFVQIEDTDGKCLLTGAAMLWRGRKWQLSYHMTETEVVMTCFKAYEAAVDHELRESFTYLGCQVMDPHRSIRSLMRLEGERDVRG